MKKRRWCIPLTVLCLVLCVQMKYELISHRRMKRAPVGTRGLFSWSSNQLRQAERGELFSVMEKRNLDTLYQSFSSDADTAVVQEFLKEAADRNISVWYLTGSPDWGLEPSGHEMVQEIRRAASCQSGLSEEARFCGILMDCEPYLTQLWDSNPEGVMDSWCTAMEHARKAANQEGLLFAVCIPYYLDDIGYSEYLKRIIEHGCDALAVMNYYRKDEAEHIEHEVEMARAARIPVTVIYELQPPGLYGLKEINTYYREGLTAVQESWNALRERFGKDRLSVAFHEYAALQEVMMRE